MNRKYTFLILFLLPIIILFNCKENTTQPEIVPPTQDHAPEIKKISPTSSVLTKHIGDNVEFRARGSDPDGDEFTFKGVYKNSEVPLIVNGDEASYTLAITERGSNFFEMIVQNEKSDTARWLINVENSKPVVSNLVLVPNNPTFQDTAKLSFDKYDAEGDSLTEFIQWYVNSSLSQDGGMKFPLSGLSYNAVVKAIVKVNDGFIDSDLKTSNSLVMPAEPDPVYELTLGLYDDFDGHGGEQGYNGSQLATSGALATALWRPDPRGTTSVVNLSTIVGDSVSVGASPSGNVVKMVNSTGGDMRLELVNPEKIDFADYQSFSADVMIPSGQSSNNLLCALDFHTSIPEQGGVSWYCQLLFRSNDQNQTYVYAQYANKNTNERWSETLKHVNKDVWYNLRMDIVKLNENEINIEFYLNNEKIVEIIPSDSEILLNPSRLLFGPKRSVEVNRLSSTGQANVFIDNVKAVYNNRTQ